MRKLRVSSWAATRGHHFQSISCMMCILHCDLATPLYYVAGLQRDEGMATRRYQYLATPLYYVAGLQLHLRLWVQVIPLNINLARDTQGHDMHKSWSESSQKQPHEE